MQRLMDSNAPGASESLTSLMGAVQQVQCLDEGPKGNAHDTLLHYNMNHMGLRPQPAVLHLYNDAGNARWSCHCRCWTSCGTRSPPCGALCYARVMCWRPQLVSSGRSWCVCSVQRACHVSCFCKGLSYTQMLAAENVRGPRRHVRNTSEHRPPPLMPQSAIRIDQGPGCSPCSRVVLPLTVFLPCCRRVWTFRKRQSAPS